MDPTFEQVSSRILLPRPELNETREEVEWRRVSLEEKASMRDTASWDIDYIGVVCKGSIFAEDPKVHVILGSSSAKFFEKCCLNIARQGSSTKMLCFGKIGSIF
jgi:hypothetical protein